MDNFKLKVHAGSNFTETAEDAKKIACTKRVNVEFDFNGVCCVVSSATNLEWLSRDYMNSWTMEWKTVGPDCVEKYSEKVQSDLDERTKIKEEKRAKEQAEYRAKEAKEKEKFESSVKGIDLELSDADGWQTSRANNQDGYGGAALDYAEAWGKLMQIEIAKGKTIEQCYDYTQNGLGFLGITGFQFGCAVSVLSQTWKHGEDLRRVHNSKYGVKESKGTVNPAVLRFR